ncbi:hypothetical protein V5O48_016573 [Marasmius crinis-equi]|uniref:Uncharacterized protein n=1 Tax=Marasmius crinis-equi TaxID=585013 RepID=A0ABR3ERH6_9AGAR
MDSSFLSGFSDSSTKPLLEYSGNGSLIHTGSLAESRSGPELDIISSFKSDGFSDFELDLGCLSNPPSPLAGITPLASSEHVGALELAPDPILMPKRSPSMKSLSFFSSLPGKRDPTPSPKMPPLDFLKNSGPSEPRGGWPLIRYVGRGTPVDSTRRIEWGNGSTDDAPNEHGVLFSSSGGRANSLDSAARPTSQDWHHVGSSHSHTLSGPPRALSPLLQLSLDTSPLEPLPETSKLQIKGIESDADDWSSVIDTVMKSGEPSGSGSGDAGAVKVTPPAVPEKAGDSTAGATSQSASAPNEFAMFGLDTAVDLGLGLGKGMNFFNLGLAPGTSDIGHQRASTTGRDSPSVYSTAPPTPEGPSPPASVAGNDDKKEERNEKSQVQRVNRTGDDIDDEEGDGSSAALDSPTTTSGKYDDHHHRVAQWWKRLFLHLRKIQLVIKAAQRHKN